MNVAAPVFLVYFSIAPKLYIFYNITIEIYRLLLYNKQK